MENEAKRLKCFGATLGAEKMRSAEAAKSRAAELLATK
jgi:hypothetical protein